MSAMNSMVNGRQLAGVPESVLAQVNLYQQMDNDRYSLIQVSILLHNVAIIYPDG